MATQPLPRKPQPRGTTPTPSNIPPTPHPHFTGPSPRTFRIITFILGAGVGLCLFTFSVHAEAEIKSERPQIPGGVTPVSVEQKDQVSDARKHLGVYVWGIDSASETKNSPAKNIRFFAGKVFRDLVLGNTHAAAIDLDGNLWQWHSNSPAPLTADGLSSLPQVTLKGQDLVQAACTNQKVYALSRSGEVFCFSGDGSASANGVSSDQAQANSRGWWPLKASAPSITKLTLPSGVSRGDKITSIASGAHHLVAITSCGKVLTIPSDIKGNQYGQLGLEHADLPTALLKENDEHPDWAVKFNLVSKLDNIAFERAACGENHTLVRTKDGRVFAFGANGFGQLASEPDYNSKEPYVAVPREVDAIWNPPTKGAKPLDAACTDIAAGGNTSFFVVNRVESTDVLACGTGLHGQLGNGSYSHMTANPVRIKTLSNLSEYDEIARRIRPIRIYTIAVSPNGSHCAAVLDNGTGDDTTKSPRTWFGSKPSLSEQTQEYGRDVLVWGSNQNEQLGRGDGKKSNSAVPIYPKAIPYSHLADPVEELKEAALGVVEEELGVGPVEMTTGWVSENAGRLQLAPCGVVEVGSGKKVRAEQKMVVGKYVTGVYFKSC
ncbi:hypothetical protein SpCBS45565_g01392 [Spizellomyces sp. 'palustris']|nr:hypothetical protein SpCBS45565_g01392 [Spizellomyces sp. 'palustris']